MRKLEKYTQVLAVLVVGTVVRTFPAPATDPYAKPDDTWIHISGKVESVRANALTLDYGDGTITVEMDDGDRDADGYKLTKGDKVTVTDRIEDDSFETTKIKADSVYVESLATYFHASAVDEDVGDRVSVTGKMDSDLFEGRELEARTILGLEDS